jgi:hypothetical protein
MTKVSKEFAEDAESDTLSNVSDVPSIFSTGSSLESNISSSSLQEALVISSEHMAEILLEDNDIRPLYLEALAKFGKHGFAKIHDRLLRKFFKDVRSETQNRLHLEALRFLRNQSQVAKVTDFLKRIKSKMQRP